MAIHKIAVPIAVAGVTLVLTLGLTGPEPVARAAPLSERKPDEAMSAGLLRRLAEAADGYRTGERIWIVARTEAPYQIVGIFTDTIGAARAKGTAPGVDFFGPFVTPRDYNRAVLLVPVRHRPPTIYGLDTLASWRLPEPPLFMDDLDSVVITAYNRRGVAWHGSAPGRDIDAGFFTLAAQDKFVFPYYSSVSGLDAALRMRESVADYIRRAPPR
jgi:hypothetical protein